jgi:hypothetical protein
MKRILLINLIICFTALAVVAQDDEEKRALKNKICYRWKRHALLLQ